MALSKTAMDKITAEAAADQGTPPTTKKRPTAARKPLQPAQPVAGPSAPAYSLNEFELTERDGVVSWKAFLLLGPDKVARAVYSGPRKTAVVEPLASTTGAKDEVTRFEDTAKALLGGPASVGDLLAILSVCSEKGITPFNRGQLLTSISGSLPLATDPSLIVPTAR